MKIVRAAAIFALVIASSSATFPVTAGADPVNVTQHHNNPSRDGLFIDPAFTASAATALTRDLSFNGTIMGNVYAQPLYIENGPDGAAMVIAVTESNNVYALNATTGAIIWQRTVGTPVTSGLPCGNINPLGITGTPVVDLASRSLFFDAEVSGIGHQIYSLNVDTGAINAGWPLTVSTAVPVFDSDRSQSERAALAIVGNIVYVPYGGRAGDCGSYHGRVVGVQINNPASVMNWATVAGQAGIWGPGGIASDGTNTFVVTGNTFDSGSIWHGSEAVIRLQPGPVFSGSTTDYWAPTNWQSLDSGDNDLGGSGAILVDVPGATPSALVVALGKDGNAYLINRTTMGGVSAPVASSNVNSGATIIQAAATYKTAQGTYVVFRGSGSVTTAFRITATNPPAIATGWSVTGQNGRGSPFVTSTDGTSNAIVWVVGAEGDQKLHGYNGDTGAVVFGGGGASELMSGTQRYNTGIAARGRIYIATNNKVFAFGVPVTATPTPTPTTPTPTPTPTQTPTPTPTVSISGNISYCSNPVPGPVPNVTLILTGSGTGTTFTDASGNYQFSSLVSGGTYNVTPSKAALLPGSGGIDTVDVVATQRHFLHIGAPLSGCRLMAADVNGDAGVDTVDVIAIQRFYLGLTTGTATTGQYQFNPASRSYPGIVSDQTGQNYDTLVFGDVASGFVHRP